MQVFFLLPGAFMFELRRLWSIQTPKPPKTDRLFSASHPPAVLVNRLKNLSVNRRVLGGVGSWESGGRRYRPISVRRWCCGIRKGFLVSWLTHAWPLRGIIRTARPNLSFSSPPEGKTSTEPKEQRPLSSAYSLIS